MAGVLVALTTVATAPSAEAEPQQQPDPQPAPLGLFEPEPPSAAEVAAAKAKIKSLNGRLRTLQPYVHTAADRTQTLDLTAARVAGHDEGLLTLAGELVSYQNALLAKARQATTGVALPQVDVEEYPAVRRLFSAASAAAVTELRDEQPVPATPLDLTGVDPCGDWYQPLPANPVARRVEGPYTDVEAALVRAGYHHTAGHACGHPNQAGCATDFTRGTAVRSPAGACQSPRFRDQAIPSYSMPGYVRVQYGEPNPEFETYAWPYWSWAAYVTWWHRRF
jgi:hypothetical protein